MIRSAWLAVVLGAVEVELNLTVVKNRVDKRSKKLRDWVTFVVSVAHPKLRDWIAAMDSQILEKEAIVRRKHSQSGRTRCMITAWRSIDARMHNRK
jgi:DNA repair ATPase RecN